jgi:hypothetical protein
MEISEAREFLKNNHGGCLVTCKKDGSLQMTLVSPVPGANGNVLLGVQWLVEIRELKGESWRALALTHCHFRSI